jgi:transcriptional regulator with XRE-family HTH domain
VVAVATANPIGQLLREWRQRRSLSQLELASGSAISARHLSFVETGRARPSREMVLHLADRLDVPLRARNRMLLAAGYAPVFGERPLDAGELTPVRDALTRFLEAHEPYPAIVVDRHWNLSLGNRASALLVEGVAEDLLAPPANVHRIALHPRGMAPRIVNFEEWSGHLLHRLRREVELSGDEELERLYDELVAYDGVTTDEPLPQSANDILLPLEIRLGNATLSFFSTVTVFGTALDVTLSELAIEAFYPADAETAAALHAAADR